MTEIFVRLTSPRVISDGCVMQHWQPFMKLWTIFFWWTPNLLLLALGFSAQCWSSGFKTVMWIIVVPLTDSYFSREFSESSCWLHYLECQIRTKCYIVACCDQHKGARPYMIVYADLTDGGSNRRILFMIGYPLMILRSEETCLKTVIHHSYYSFCPYAHGIVGCVMLYQPHWGKLLNWPLVWLDRLRYCFFVWP